MTRKIIGLDLNGWHDQAANDWPDEDEGTSGLLSPSSYRCIDGGIASVVVDLKGLPSEAVVHQELSFVGGPQAILSPVGVGSGWGEVGREERRVSVASVLQQCLSTSPAPFLKRQLKAAIDALTRQSDEVLLAVPDLSVIDDIRQEFLLDVIRRRGLTARLLWRSVAATLYAQETNRLPFQSDGMRIACLDHTSTGFDFQVLTLRHLPDHAGIFAPERKGAGKSLHNGCGLNFLLERAKHALARANPHLEGQRLAPSRLPVRILMEEQFSEHDEILRHANGTWFRVMAPDDVDVSFVGGQLSLPPLDDVDVVLLVTPLRNALGKQLAGYIQAATTQPVILLENSAVAKGALVAGRRIERGIPHYLDYLEQMSLAVLRGDTVALEDLISDQAVVPANREYRSKPVSGFGWPAGAKGVAFYLRKAGEFRKWQTDEITPPVATMPVEIQLSQWPAQGRAQVFVTSQEWDTLRQRPVYLDWSKLTVDHRSFEEIAEELRPKPVIPERVVGFTHESLWNDALRGRTLQSFLAGLSLDDPDDLNELTKALREPKRVFIEASEGARSGWRAASLLDYDGNPPVGADPTAVKLLDEALRRLSNTMLACLREKVPFQNNSLLLTLTWSFGRCPVMAQKEMLHAAVALFAGRSHPLLTPNVQSRKALMHGLGRVLKEPILLSQFLDLLLGEELSGHAPAALASVLGRPEATPRIFTEERAARTAFRAANYLDHLKRELQFGLGLKYGLNIVAGLLRCREVRPYALVRANSKDAARLWSILSRIRELLSARRSKFSQSDQKLAIIESLMEMLDGSGGRRGILMQIEELSDTD